MATNKRKRATRPAQGRQGGGGQQSGGNRLRALTGKGTGRKRKAQSATIGKQGGASGH